jgi:hypothetical protein
MAGVFLFFCCFCLFCLQLLEFLKTIEPPIADPQKTAVILTSKGITLATMRYNLQQTHSQNWLVQLGLQDKDWMNDSASIQQALKERFEEQRREKLKAKKHARKLRKPKLSEAEDDDSILDAIIETPRNLIRMISFFGDDADSKETEITTDNSFDSESMEDVTPEEEADFWLDLFARFGCATPRKPASKSPGL